MNPPDDTAVTNNRNPSTACPRCGAELPTMTAIVCPRCDAILRPDPEVEETRKEGQKSRKLLLMVICALCLLAGLSALFNREPVVPLILTCIYIAAFDFSARRTNDTVKLIALSLLVWLGYCAVVIAVLFAGCMVVFRGGFGG